MIPIKDKDNKIKNINPDRVKWFGTEVKRVYKKDGDFKRFESLTWIQTYKGDRFYTDLSIGKLKKQFKFFQSDKKVIKELKKGKFVKAIEWCCETVKERGTKIRNDEMKQILESIRRHRPFTLDGKYLYYYIDGRVFKDSRNGRLVYVDIKKNILVNVNIDGKLTANKIEEWIIKYNSKK